MVDPSIESRRIDLTHLDELVPVAGNYRGCTTTTGNAHVVLDLERDSRSAAIGDAEVSLDLEQEPALASNTAADDPLSSLLLNMATSVN